MRRTESCTAHRAPAHAGAGRSRRRWYGEDMRLAWVLAGLALLGCGRSHVHPPPLPASPAPCDGRSHLATQSHGVRDVRLAAGEGWGIAWAVNEPDGAHGGSTDGMETEV